jgi:hypothetical protein
MENKSNNHFLHASWNAFVSHNRTDPSNDELINSPVSTGYHCTDDTYLWWPFCWNWLRDVIVTGLITLLQRSLSPRSSGKTSEHRSNNDIRPVDPADKRNLFSISSKSNDVIYPSQLYLISISVCNSNDFREESITEHFQTLQRDLDIWES